jgi:hypothetical protein
MSDLVRVRLENGMETNVSPALAEIAGLTPLDEPTHNPDGTTRPDTKGGRTPKPKASVADKAAEKKA